MLSSKTIALSLVVIYSVSIQRNNGNTVGSRQSQHFQRGFLKFGKKSYDQGNFVFAVCDKSTRSSAECNVVQRIYPSNENRSCLVTLEADNSRSELSIIIDVATLGKDKAAIFWGEEFNVITTITIGTVDFKTCQMNEVKISDPRKNILRDLLITDKIVTNNDGSFDIFIDDSKRFGDKLGKLHIIANGTANSESIASNIPGGSIVYASSIATRSPSKGYAYLERSDKDFTLSIVKPDGTTKRLAIYDYPARPVVLSSDDVVSVCTAFNVDRDGATCSQYDADGNAKFTTIVGQNKYIQPKALYNLPNGGMLVMIVEANTFKDKNHRMVRIDEGGNIAGTEHAKEFDNVSSKPNKTTYVYKHGDSEYCAALVGKNPSGYDILHHCVKENDFH